MAYAAIGKAVDWFGDDPDTVRILVKGTGLLGTASHSVDERQEHFEDTVQAIADHPWMGSSLGGVTESVASYMGIKPQNFEETKRFEGQSIFAEVVVASGIPGSIPFFCFMAIYLAAPLLLARSASPFQAAWLRALVLSLAFEWAILQFNQNILRLYLWVHIAVLATVFAAVQRQYGEPEGSGSLVAGYGAPNLLA
jgi:O-antigen ligase